MKKRRRRELGGQGAFAFWGPSKERDFAIAGGMPEGEFGAVMMIASMDNPANPPCSGPVVVHADGTIECEGGCKGVAFAYHGPDGTVGCGVYGPSTSWQCDRCRT
jgi:hypothetical protein